MRRFAILVAADEYQHFSPTPFCHLDAKLLQSTLTTKLDYAPQDVTTLLLGPLGSEQPGDVLQHIEATVKLSSDGDTILFYFAGHGDYFEGEPYLILPSTEPAQKRPTALSLRAIAENLRSPNRLNVRILDACHSGCDVRSPELGVVNASGFVRSLSKDASEGWVTLAACKADEFSYPDQEERQGVFTLALCQAIRNLKDGSQAYPEILKVETTRIVETWANRHGLVQTPTINASISGNLSIGVRAQDAPLISRTECSSKSAAESIDIKTNEEHIARLARLRRFGRINDDRHRQALRSLIQQYHNSLLSHAARIPGYGCQIAVGEPNVIQAEIPDQFRAVVISAVAGKKIRPLHKVRTWREYKDQDGHGSYLGFAAPWMNRQFVDHHIVEQTAVMPPSCVTLRLSSDGYVPNVLGLVYLCPLQLRVLAIYAIATGGTDQGESVEWEHPKITMKFVTLEEAGADAVDAECTAFVAGLAKTISDALSQRLNYLEFEEQQE